MPEITDLVNFLKIELGIAEVSAVDVTFVDEDVMAELHMRYMGLLGPTDVLSFPATDVAHGPIDPQGLQDEATLGDIVICPDFIESNTRSDQAQMNVDACVIHGLLHLVGYDHDNEISRLLMMSEQERLLEIWRNQIEGRGVSDDQ